MTEEQIALAKRAVACKGWRWMPGMHTANEERVIGVMRDDVLHLCAPLDAALESVSITRVFFDSSGSCLPDLTDSATLGCLLALVREAWGDKIVIHIGLVREAWGDEIVIRIGGGWFYVDTERHLFDDTSTLSLLAALVRALEAAP